MRTSMDKMRAEDEKLNVKLEESHGDFDKMKAAFEKRIKLYNIYLKDDDLTDRLDRLTLENKKEWTMSHLLNLIIEKELRDRITDLMQRVHQLEKAAQLE